MFFVNGDSFLSFFPPFFFLYFTNLCVLFVRNLFGAFARIHKNTKNVNTTHSRRTDHIGRLRRRNARYVLMLYFEIILLSIWTVSKTPSALHRFSFYIVNRNLDRICSQSCDLTLAVPQFIETILLYFFFLCYSDQLLSPSSRQRQFTHSIFASFVDRPKRAHPLSIVKRPRPQHTGQSNASNQPSQPHRFSVQKVNNSSHSNSDDESDKIHPDYSPAWSPAPSASTAILIRKIGKIYCDELFIFYSLFILVINFILDISLVLPNIRIWLYSTH